MKKIKKQVKQMKIYYLEFKNSVKFYNEEMDKSIEIEKSKLLELFLKAIYKKYGKKVKFESLIQKKLKKMNLLIFKIKEGENNATTEQMH